MMNTDQLAASDLNMKDHFFWPLFEDHGWWEFYADNGGSMWQSEPMLQFMHYCLRTFNSPYWNPYSAAGQLGPETLVDLKFSVFTILYALIGGGSLTYNLVILGLYVMGAYCVIRLMRDKFELSWIAAVGAAFFYILNGHAMANATSNTFLSYQFVPLCLLCVTNYINAPTAKHFVYLTFAFAFIFSYSFLPTTLMSAIAIACFIVAYLFDSNVGHASFRSVAIRMLGISAAVAAACAMLAVFFLPFIESISQTDTLNSYQDRVFYPAFLAGLFSLFTPTHFYESYNAMELPATTFFSTPSGTFTATGNTIYHYGVVSMLVAACGIRLGDRRRRGLMIVCLGTLTVGFGRLFSLPFIDPIVAHLPILRNIACQYWWILITLPLLLLVARGLDNIARNRASKSAFTLMFLLCVGSGLYTAQLYGLHQPRLLFKCAMLILSAGLLVIMGGMMWSRSWRCARYTPTKKALIIVSLLVTELLLSSKQVRMRAVDYFNQPPQWVHYVREHIGPYRTLTLNAYGMMGERGSAFQIPEVTSMNEGTLASYTKYFHQALILDPMQVNPNFVTLRTLTDQPEKNIFHWPKIDLLGVKYLLVPAGHVNYERWLLSESMTVAYRDALVTVMENPHVLPRAFVVPGQKAEDEITLPKNYRASIEPAEIAKYRNAEVELKGRSKKGGLLVLSDNWHPNWSATVNGEPASIVKVEGTFRGVVVPAGDYTVAMRYRPKTLTASLIISSISLVSLLLMLAFSRKNRR